MLSLALPLGLNAKTLKMAYDADPVRWTRDLEFEPRLAESWKRTDPRTVRFQLRKGVRFHSGNTFSARDVA